MLAPTSALCSVKREYNPHPDRLSRFYYSAGNKLVQSLKDNFARRPEIFFKAMTYDPSNSRNVY